MTIERRSGMPAVILGTASLTARIFEILRQADGGVSVHCVERLDQLESPVHPAAMLLAMGTGEIVPTRVLTQFRVAYNVHAASPAYPGRDPHHFAAYDRVREYGATLHVMTERVDEGPIVGLERFPVAAGTGPLELLRAANEAGLRLVRRLAGAMLGSRGPIPSIGIEWSGRKRTRKDFLDMCRIDTAIEPRELGRRVHAFSVPGRRNLYVTIHGVRFSHAPEPQEPPVDGAE